MKRSDYKVILIGFVILPVLLIQAVYGAGTTSANFLKIAPGARPAAMGEAFTSIVNDASAIYWNSAALSTLKSKEIFVAHNVWFQDINHSFVAFALPVGSTLTRDPMGKTIGVSVTYLNTGFMERRDDSGTLQNSNFDASDMAVSLGYGRSLLNYTGLPLSGGVSLKFIRQNIAEYSANSVAMDFGLLYPFTVSNVPLSLGFAVNNIGTPIKFINQSYPLPVTVKAGLSYIPKLSDQMLPLALSGDVIFPNDGEMGWRIGTEYAVGSILALRFGYSSQDSLTRNALSGGALGTSQDSSIMRMTGFMAGIGVTLPLNRLSDSLNILNLDYAFVPYGELGNTHRISLGMKW